ncbi:hypothetical protein [Halopelagius longus]|uniref:Uncharacterized protein n=1 Tax=Halopelagius longus TaxID=1236180 RepID=A0A1H1BJP4_9EURY|nr:hypothetical protein [Halopelagius longus]RDI70813.1 hypothetical protein DWB78_03205 [Halopelagius longus]SDQ52168.1 hypothetical protein SAMN05216278_1829 [Halopelagius longus]
MSRDTATTDAAVNGMVALALFAVGALVAARLTTGLDGWVGIPLAVAVGGACSYFAFQQIAHGVYTLVEDATSGRAE